MAQRVTAWNDLFVIYAFERSPNAVLQAIKEPLSAVCECWASIIDCSAVEVGYIIYESKAPTVGHVYETRHSETDIVGHRNAVVALVSLWGESYSWRRW